MSDDQARLDELERAFAAGNYRQVREGTAGLSKSEDEATRLRARALYEKTEPDPRMKWLFLVALAVVVAVTAYWMRR